MYQHQEVITYLTLEALKLMEDGQHDEAQVLQQYIQQLKKAQE